MVSASGASTRSFTAIKLEETVSIGYGEEQQDCKEYELRSITFYVGNSSSNGHYTCAERTQTLGGYKWRYLDSGETPVEKSLAELYKEHGRGVAGLLLVAKTQPKGDKAVVLAKERPR